MPAVISSPLTAIGTAGGQETVGEASILPRAASVGMRSDFEKIASLALSFLSPGVRDTEIGASAVLGAMLIKS